MRITTLTSRELDQDASRARKAARDGPVIITDRGRPSHVLMTYDEFRRLSGQCRSLALALSAPGLSDIDFDPPRMRITPGGPDLA